MARVRDAKPIRCLLNCCIALVALATTSLAIYHALPLPLVEEVWAKLRAFNKNKDDFTTVFVGSSHVQTGIAATQFDAALREMGHDSRSFNFGISGVRPPESFFIARKLLALKPKRLKWIVIELEPMRAEVPPIYAGTVRAIYWHDLKSTLISLREICARCAENWRQWSWQERWSAIENFAIHVRLMILNYSNLGRAKELFADRA